MESSCRYCNTVFENSEDLYKHIRSSECSDRNYKKKRETVLENSLTEESITFGKYKGFPLCKMLRDRKYCSWLLEQDWFGKQYEYLYNRVKDYKPREYFVTKPHLDIAVMNVEEFLKNYEYFYLTPLEELKIELENTEKECYTFYLLTIESLKKQIGNDDKNPFNIKAPSSWLKKFEKDYGIPRDTFKEFLSCYDLPNIPYIIEDIKKTGGLEYKGAKSFIIAKENSLKQEKFWEDVLKTFYGDEIGSQFKYHNCFFDFIRINTKTLYECKMSTRDFNDNQHNKYLSILGNFYIVYLIGNDCIVDLKTQVVYSLDPIKYDTYFKNLKTPNKFEDLVRIFPIIEISDFTEYFGKR